MIRVTSHRAFPTTRCSSRPSPPFLSHLRLSRLRSPPLQRTFTRPFLTTTLDTAHTLLTALHSTTHLPWSVALPLTALLIRLALILPLTIYTRRSQQRQLALQPLLKGWQHHIRRTTLATSHALGPAECTNLANRALHKQRLLLYSRFNCPRWKSYLPPLAQLPVFLVVIETIRRMCGTHSGLLGLITTNPVTSTPLIDADATRGAALSTILTAPESHIEPSLATEGALWFPDLLVPDPHLLLPFILSGTLFLNIHLGTRPRSSLAPPPTTFQRRVTITLKTLALAIGPATLNVPAGMLVYWTSSAVFALGMGRALDRWMPFVLPGKSKGFDGKGKREGLVGLKRTMRGEGRVDTVTVPAPVVQIRGGKTEKKN